MQSLIGGADCAAISNPLDQMMKREAVDRSTYRDRIASNGERSSSSRVSSQTPFRPLPASFTPQLVSRNTTPSSLAQQQQQQRANSTSPQQQARGGWNSEYSGSVRQFNSPSGQGQGQGDVRLMEEAFKRGMMVSPAPAPPNQQIVSAQRNSNPASGWMSEFVESKGKGKARANDVQSIPYEQQYQQQQQIPYQSYQQPYQPSQYSSVFQPQSQFPMYQSQSFLPQQQQQPAQIIPLSNTATMNGQPMTDQELEEAFAQAQQEQEKELDAGLKERVAEGFVGDGVREREEGRETGSGMGGDFEAVWQSLRPEADRLQKLSEWESQFNELKNHAAGREEDLDAMGLNFDPKFEEGDWDLGRGMRDEDGEGRGALIGEDGYPVLGDYEFEQGNPHSAEPNTLQRALSLLQSGGSLTEATLLLEATLSSGTAAEQALSPSSQQNEGIPTLAGGEAAVWVLLGQIQAMDEKEVAAVRALEEGRRRFEVQQREGGQAEEGLKTMGEGLVSLAISYTNESYDQSALLSLHRYLSLLHPSYAGAVPSAGPDLTDENGAIPNPWAANQALTESYLALARDQHAEGKVDADVQVGLGVLYYQTGEFERARDCWVAALGVRPNDFLLWNRLGATLANSGHPEEAVDAYRRALELKPTFTRAIYNMGVSCLNIGVHQEAAEHLLAGLALHQIQGGGGVGPNITPETSSAAANHSSTLWSTLRRTFVAMDRHDLAEKAVPGANLQTFRTAGFDF